MRRSWRTPPGAAGRCRANACSPTTGTAARRSTGRRSRRCATRVAAGEVETVVAWSADRVSRNFAHQMLLQEEFARHGARIVFVQEPDDATPQGMLLRQMLSAISEYERTQIAERSRRGKIHRARLGSLNMISRPPYGYRLIRKTEESGARLEIDEVEAAVVRRIFDLYVREALTMNAVARRLDAEGAPPRHADRWPTATVAVVLRNEAYVGRAAYLKTAGTGLPARRNRTGRRQAGRVRRTTGRTARRREDWIELPVPAIVEPTVFEQAQRRRAENRRFSPRRTADPTLLQGLCVCAECGYTMGRTPARAVVAAASTTTAATASTPGAARRAPSATTRRRAPGNSTPRSGRRCSGCSATPNWSSPRSNGGSPRRATPPPTIAASRSCGPSRRGTMPGCAVCSTPTRRDSCRSTNCATATRRCTPANARSGSNSMP